MESISVRHLIFSTKDSSCRRRSKNPLTQNPHKRRRFRTHDYVRRFSFPVIKNYKQFEYEDFQGYAKPSRLLLAEELKVCSETSEPTASSIINLRTSLSLFKVKLQTSSVYGSSLSNPNAGVLLCLIGTNGDSILQRIPVILKPNSSESLDTVESNARHFQRGYIDVFTFEGPKWESLEAIWVGVDSGQWRLGGLGLTVINAHQPASEGNDEEVIRYTGFQYEFEVDDVLVGEGSDLSMLELRPSQISELSGVDPFTMLNESPSQSTLQSDGRISNEESMREYAELKKSLLYYDAGFIFVGTTIANFTAGESTAFAFFVGGIGGFLYLLLLQRSVDGLQASQSVSTNADGNAIDRLFRGFKGPISSLALAIGLTALAAKYSFGDIPSVLTPKELLVGMMGFLACKVAVVLAAFKPMEVDLEENK